MKRPNPPLSPSVEASSRQPNSKQTRTLAGDVGNVFRKTGEFITDHKWQTIGGAVLALTVAGGLTHWATEAQNSADAKASFDAQQEFKQDLDSVALHIANPKDVVQDSTIVDPGNHLSDEAIAFADENKIDHQEDGVDTILETAIAISKANLIHPNSKFVISEVDVNGDGTKEAVVQVAPEDLPTLSQ
jgi:hypothetical protein